METGVQDGAEASFRGRLGDGPRGLRARAAGFVFLSSHGFSDSVLPIYLK